MNQSANPLVKISAEYVTYFAKFSSLQLFTIGKNGRLESSYTPFLVDQKNIFIFTSPSLQDIRAICFMITEPELCKLKPKQKR